MTEGCGEVPVATGMPGLTAIGAAGCGAVPVAAARPARTLMLAAGCGAVPVAAGMPAIAVAETAGCGAAPVAAGIPGLAAMAGTAAGAVPVAAGMPAGVLALAVGCGAAPAAAGAPARTLTADVACGAVPVADAAAPGRPARITGCGAVPAAVTAGALTVTSAGAGLGDQHLLGGEKDGGRHAGGGERERPRGDGPRHAELVVGPRHPEVVAGVELSAVIRPGGPPGSRRVREPGGGRGGVVPADRDNQAGFPGPGGSGGRRDVRGPGCPVLRHGRALRVKRQRAAGVREDPDGSPAPGRRRAGDSQGRIGVPGLEHPVVEAVGVPAGHVVRRVDDRPPGRGGERLRAVAGPAGYDAEVPGLPSGGEGDDLGEGCGGSGIPG